MYYGFDIGGTKIALGVFDSTRRLQWEKRVPTPHTSYSAFLDAVCELVAEADQRFGVKGSVGIGIPGMPETEDGTLYAANVPAASGKPLRADLSARWIAMCVWTMTLTVLPCPKPGMMNSRNILWLWGLSSAPASAVAWC